MGDEGMITESTPYISKGKIAIYRIHDTGEYHASIKGWTWWVCLKAECREDAIKEAKHLLRNPPREAV